MYTSWTMPMKSDWDILYLTEEYIELKRKLSFEDMNLVLRVIGKAQQLALDLALKTIKIK